MDELVEQFLIEGRELVVQAQRELARLAEGRDGAALDAAFRAIHTLKGSVAIFAMKPAERVLHAGEDILDSLRKTGGALTSERRGALVAMLDQVDRWIDDMERRGALGEEAGAIADRLLALLGGNEEATPSPTPVAAPATWIEALRAREAALFEGQSEPLIAFRYSPAADCFFRGDDPLAIVAALPELRALAILPSEPFGPLDEWDPFRCVTRLEGVSAAPLEAVRLAFRMVVDQVELAPIEPSGAPVEDVAPGGSTTLRVDGSRIDALSDQLAELIVATSGIAPLAERAASIDPILAASLRTVQAEIERVTGAVHRAASAMRLVPLGGSFRRLPRLVREIAGALNRPVELVLAGEGVEIDKNVADALHEPLLHLIRNAIDHGIEDEAGRRAAGKPGTGAIHLSARRDGDRIVISLADDGRGIDPARIRAMAVKRGLVGAAEADALSDAQALRLIFLPGFSTAGAVTDLSGRGVGMDAVRIAVERHRGSIEIDSRPGEGSTIRLLFPVQALTTALLVVRAGADRFGIPLDQIVETVQLDTAGLIAVGSGTACVLRERTVPVLALAELLGLEAREGAAARLIVTRVEGEAVAVRVEGFEQRLDALVRPKRGLLAHVPCVLGTAVLGDGGVLIVLDLPELAA